ncbi:MAG: diacylglycerol kinase family protein [Bacteroides sp.]|nr:diacylglycerol kinase family protein [Bacteroides sp.]
MKETTKFSWRKRAMAFKYAWQGLVAMVKYEHNARIHLVAAGVAIVAGFLFEISAMEWCLIVVCIGLVISAEALNSAVEALADKITEERDPLIGRAKDLGATAVTLLALVAVVVGMIIFLPKIINLFC